MKWSLALRTLGRSWILKTKMKIARFHESVQLYVFNTTIFKISIVHNKQYVDQLMARLVLQLFFFDFVSPSAIVPTERTKLIFDISCLAAWMSSIIHFWLVRDPLIMIPNNNFCQSSIASVESAQGHAVVVNISYTDRQTSLQKQSPYPRARNEQLLVIYSFWMKS